jgi:putative transposase
MLMRYVEGNPIRAKRKLVARAQQWAWSSLGCGGQTAGLLLNAWPMQRPPPWTASVNAGLRDREMNQLRTSVQRDRPLGSPSWVRRMAETLGLEYTLRDRGRPRKRDTAG